MVLTTLRNCVLALAVMVVAGCSTPEEREARTQEAIAEFAMLIPICIAHVEGRAVSQEELESKGYVVRTTLVNNRLRMYRAYQNANIANYYGTHISFHASNQECDVTADQETIPGPAAIIFRGELEQRGFRVLSLNRGAWEIDRGSQRYAGFLRVVTGDTVLTSLAFERVN